MDWEELNELGADLLSDIESAFSEYDFISVDREGITPDGDGAIYEVCISWDYSEMGDVTDDDIESALDNALEDWEGVSRDWDGSQILVALHVDDYDEEDDEEDEDDEDDGEIEVGDEIDCPRCTGTAVWDGEFYRCDTCGFCGNDSWRE